MDLPPGICIPLVQFHGLNKLKAMWGGRGPTGIWSPHPEQPFNQHQLNTHLQHWVQKQAGILKYRQTRNKPLKLVSIGGKTTFLLTLESWAPTSNHPQQFSVIAIDYLLFSFVSAIFIFNKDSFNFFLTSICKK